MEKLHKKLIVIGVVTVMLLSTFGMLGCRRQLSHEEHIERISARVERRFFAEGVEYDFEDFWVEILYDPWDRPIYFMVQFEPKGFLYGRIIGRNYYYLTFPSSFFRDGWVEWHRYISDNEEDEWYGEWHDKNHFCTLGITDERRYMSLFKGVISPSVRRGDIFLCLDSGMERRIGEEPVNVRLLRGWRSRL